MTKYINKIQAMTLRELREEISKVNSNLTLLTENSITKDYCRDNLASCCIALDNFFEYAAVDQDKTLRELKEGSRK